MITFKTKVTLTIYYITCVFALAYEGNVYVHGSNSEMMENGKIQFQLLQERGNLPQYGSCWKQSVIHIEEGCRSLSEETQSDIALHLTNCFLGMSGHETYDCVSDKKPNLRGICINSMTDRAFNVYTEFYTHTQNMCWFLRGQIWHETIDQNTKRVGKQLVESSEKQKQLLLNQQESLLLQEKMLSYSVELQNILKEFYVSSQKHQNLLQRMSGTLNQLQNWLLGEISWFDTIIFHVSASFVIMFFTATQRTIKARFPLVILLSSTIAIERFICNNLSKSSYQDDINIVHKMYYNYVWTVRYIFITLSAIIIGYYGITYKDYLQNNNMLMIKLFDKINKITAYIESTTDNNEAKRKSIISFISECQKNDNSTISNNSESVINNINTRKSVPKDIGYNTDSSRSQTPQVHCERVPNSLDISRRMYYKSSESVDKDISRYNLRSRLATPDKLM